jgi:hypothetical protein
VEDLFGDNVMASIIPDELSLSVRIGLKQKGIQKDMKIICFFKTSSKPLSPEVNSSAVRLI